MNNIQIKAGQRQAFSEVFELVSTNKRINRDALKRLFEIINYKISYDHFNEIATRAFTTREWITFEEFMQIFQVKSSDFDLVDIKNALRFMAGEDDVFIPLEKLRRALIGEGQSEERVREVFKLLAAFIDKEQRFNYKEFLKTLG